VTNHHSVLKAGVIAFGLVALSLVATQCGTSPSEGEVEKRAQSPAPILLKLAFERASEEHDLDLLTMVALVQAHTGDVSSALRTIQSAASVDWRLHRFADLSKTLSAKGDIDGALQVASAIDASSSVKKEVLSEIAQAQANAGEISNAIKTAGELSGYLRADVLQAIALRQTQNKNIRDAFKTLASIDLPGDIVRRPRVLIAIAVRQADTNQVADALNTVALVDGKWKATALSEVAQSLARQKHFVRASKIADSIEEEAYTKAMTFTKIAQTCETLGDKLRGEKIRHHATEVASSIPDAEYKNLAFRAIAESAAESHDWASALQAASQVSDVSHRILALTSIAVAQRASGFRDASSTTVASASEVLRVAKDSKAVENAYFWIVVMNVRVGDLPAAIAAASHLADSQDIDQCLAFSELALAQGAAGDARGALRSIESIHIENAGGLISCTKEGTRSVAVEGAVRAKHLDAAAEIARAGPERCDMDRFIASGLVSVGDVRGSARWTYTRGSKVMEGCALLGMAEGTLNRNVVGQ
jgi:hypothetical protein